MVVLAIPSVLPTRDMIRKEAALASMALIGPRIRLLAACLRKLTTAQQTQHPIRTEPASAFRASDGTLKATDASDAHPTQPQLQMATASVTLATNGVMMASLASQLVVLSVRRILPLAHKAAIVIPVSNGLQTGQPVSQLLLTALRMLS